MPNGRREEHDSRTRAVGAGAMPPLLILSLCASGYLMAVAVGTPGHSWLAWTSLLPVFVAIRLLTPVQAAVCGALWGASLYTCSFAAGTLSPAVHYLVLLAGIPAIYSFAGARLTRWIGFSPLLLGLGWIGVELMLQPLPWRYGLLAGTQADGLLVNLVGKLLGYVFVGFLVAYVNALLLTVLSDARLPIPQARPARRKHRDTGGLVVPQTFCCVPLFAVRPEHPRAPPA